MEKIMSDLYNLQECLSNHSIQEIEKAMSIISRPFRDLCVEEYLNVKCCKKYIQYDVMNGKTYKERDGYMWEAYREKELEKIRELTDMSEKINRLIKLAKELQEASHYLEYNRSIRDAYHTVFIIEMCCAMGKQGFSLTEIAKAIPQSQIGDIYHLLTDHMGISLELSPEEQLAIEKYDANKNEEISMTDVFSGTNLDKNICFDEKRHAWVLTIEDKEQVGSALNVAQKYVGYEIRYPYYYSKSDCPKYKNDFDEIIAELLSMPGEFSIKGLEDFYSKQELGLIEALQNKIS